MNESLNLLLSYINAVRLSDYLNTSLFVFVMHVLLRDVDLAIASLCNLLEVLSALTDDYADVFIRDPHLFHVTNEGIGIANMDNRVRGSSLFPDDLLNHLLCLLVLIGGTFDKNVS